MMKETYEELEMKIIKFELNDLIQASGDYDEGDV